MIELESAVKKTLSLINKLDNETISLVSSRGRYNASELTSKISLPIFDNSAMDGYAVASADLKEATISNPINLRCIENIPSGTSTKKKIKHGTCMRIFTGSPIPEGADAVIMQEDCQYNNEDGLIQINNQVKPWENIRIQGEDVRQGDKLLSKGELINSGAIGLLNATGHNNIIVGKKPRIGLIATGNELTESSNKLELGKIYESNRGMLASIITQANGLPKIYPIVKDDLDETTSALESAITENDLIITSGGVSVGDHDFIKPALKKMGGEINLWKVSMKPGKPFMLGQVEGKTIFGLPGNPASTLITFLLLARPAILKLQGATNLHLTSNTGTLSNEVFNHSNRRHFIRVKIDENCHVSSIGNQGSHMLSNLTKINGLIDIPPNSHIAKGGEVEVLMIPS